MPTDGHRSIGERLSRAKSPKARLETLMEWNDEWRNEHQALLRKLKKSIIENNSKDIDFYLSQLDAVAIKRHDALQRIFERILKNER